MILAFIAEISFFLDFLKSTEVLMCLNMISSAIKYFLIEILNNNVPNLQSVRLIADFFFLLEQQYKNFCLSLTVKSD